jgi:hypothetical protein
MGQQVKLKHANLGGLYQTTQHEDSEDVIFWEKFSAQKKGAGHTVVLYVSSTVKGHGVLLQGLMYAYVWSTT